MREARDASPDFPLIRGATREPCFRYSIFPTRAETEIFPRYGELLLLPYPLPRRPRPRAHQVPFSLSAVVTGILYSPLHKQ
jgi:hypothetical protein